METSIAESLIQPEALADATKNREQLMAWLTKLSNELTQGKILLSRPNGDAMWEHTGLYTDGKEHRVYGKLGTAAYQPLGLLDDTVFVPGESNKFFWDRQFAIVEITNPDFEPAFKVVKTTVHHDLSGAVAFSDPERVSAEEVLKELQDELQAFGCLDTDKQDEGRKHVRAAIQLASIKLPRLDKLLDTLSADHPELGQQLEKADQVQLLASLCDWLKMKLMDDAIMRKATGITLVRNDIKAADQALALVEKTIAETPDANKASKVLDLCYMVDPLSRNVIDRSVAAGESSILTLNLVADDLRRRIKNN